MIGNVVPTGDGSLDFGFSFSLQKGLPVADKGNDFVQSSQREWSEVHTFHPRPNEISVLLLSHSKGKQGEEDGGFLTRQEKWRKRVEMKRKVERREKAKEVMKECTFKPKLVTSRVSRKGKKGRSSVISNLGSGGVIGGNEFVGREKVRSEDRFLNMSRVLRDRKNTRKVMKFNNYIPREIKELEECTFKPSINRKSRKRFDKSKKVSNSRYNKKDVFKRCYRIKTIKQVEDPECTFQPKINRKFIPDRNVISFNNSPSTKKEAKKNIVNYEYLKQNAFTRLHNNKRNKVMKKRKRSQTPIVRRSSKKRGGKGVTGRLFQTPRKSSYRTGVGPHVKMRKSLSVSITSFLDRMEKGKQNKERKMQFLKHSLQPKHRPRINKKSMKIVEEKLKKGNIGSSFLDRMEYQIRKQQCRKEIKDQQGRARFANIRRRPKISKFSKRIGKKRTFDDMSKDNERKMKRLEAKKKYLEEEKNRDFNFQPRLAKSSRSYGNDFQREQYLSYVNSENLTEKLKRIEERKRSRNQKILDERESKKMELCTFKPKIRVVPQYVKRIATGYALSKKDRPQKPEEYRRWVYN